MDRQAPAVIYLDHHATTPCDPRVVEAMLPYFSEHFGNAASITHGHGRKASLALEDARIAVARFLGVLPPEIYFTAGATESNNLALNLLQPGDHIVVGATEHKSILAAAAQRARMGVEMTLLQPDREGLMHPDALSAAFQPNTKLVSVEAANGEIGTIQPIAALAQLCRERGIRFHTDATQAVGRIPLDLTHVDMASLSAHKLYGPKGIGALFVRRGLRLPPLILGGGQERGMRAGTVNVPAVIGFATALTLRAAESGEEGPRLLELRTLLRDGITSGIDGVSVNGPWELRLPGNLNVSFERIEADSLILSMRRFSLSSGAACSSGEKGPSSVLAAIGVAPELAMGSIRFGLGKSNTREQVELLIDDLKRSVRRLREVSVS